MRATKEFFNTLRLEIEQGIKAKPIEEKDNVDLKSLQKQIKDLESENQKLKQAIEVQKQQSLPTVQESATDDKEVVKQFLNELIECAATVGNGAIKEFRVILNLYNNTHNYEYKDVVKALYDKQAEKEKTQFYIKEYVANKNVENEIQNVERGGTGVIKSCN